MLGCIMETLSVLLAAKLLISEGKPDVPLPLHGIINRSNDLSLPVDQTGSGLEIYWTYKNSILAHFTNNQLKIKKPEFIDRLETLNNGAILRINNLRKEDGGIYTANVEITDKKDKKAYEMSYNLTVYDPVPSPDIRIEVKENSTERCNVTLHCSVPSNTSDLSYTWKYRHKDPDYHLYNGRVMKNLYNNESVIQISVNYDSRDMEILCIVQNPADQKNVSYTVQNICPHLVMSNRNNQEKRHHKYVWIILALLATLNLLTLGLFLFKKKMKRGKTKGRAKEGSVEIHYADIALQSRSCDDQQKAEPKGQEHSGEIVYSTLVHHAV